MSPSGFTVRVEGMPELRKAFLAAGENLEEFRQVNRDVAGWVGPQAAAAAPRSSGMLAASWRAGATIRSASVKFGGARAPYAGVIHWGSGDFHDKRGRRMNIKPSMWATTKVSDLEPQWAKFYEHFLDVALTKAGF